jgi:hypothetical protein
MAHHKSFKLYKQPIELFFVCITNLGHIVLLTKDEGPKGALDISIH